MGGLSRGFYEMRAELARTAGASDRPLTFVLGAGASLSSAAPSTGAVHTALTSVTAARLGGDVRGRLLEIVAEEIRDRLDPLFADVRPNAGYRLLAAIGRARRVNIVNLNWDDAAEIACRLAGVPHVAFDPNDGQTLAEAEAGLPDGHGVLVVHVHGTLDRRPRYSMLETLPSDSIWSTIRPLLAHVVIICGASLGGDADVALAVHKARLDESSTVWVFARETAALGDLPSHWWKVISPDVDFDLLAITLAEEFWAHKDRPRGRRAPDHRPPTQQLRRGGRMAGRISSAALRVARGHGASRRKLARLRRPDVDHDPVARRSAGRRMT